MSDELIELTEERVLHYLDIQKEQEKKQHLSIQKEVTNPHN